MKNTFVIALYLFLVLFGACSPDKTIRLHASSNIEQEIKKLSEAHTTAERNDDLKSFLSIYTDSIISMPEYQPLLMGSQEIKVFYEEIFQRQDIKTFEKTIEEIISLDSTILEYGTFKKEYIDLAIDTLFTQQGKYCHVWNVLPDGTLKIKGETFGFFHPVDHLERLVVRSILPHPSEVYSNQNIPYELTAYNALIEKLVKIRDGASRSEVYAPDGKFWPYAEQPVSGDEIKPYLTAYSKRGEVHIDSVAVYTYHYERFDQDLLEYVKFKVRWTTLQGSGRTEGKGIRLWKRQEDKSIKVYREMGSHDFIEN